MEFITSRILNEEMRRILQECCSSQQELLISDLKGRNQFHNPNPRDKRQGKLNKYANVECHHCKKKGHKIFLPKIKIMK